MRIVYAPGSSRLAGNANRPCASLTTVIVIVDPVRLALTSTPSIGPSPCDETMPVSAAADCAAGRLAAAAPSRANETPWEIQKTFIPTTHCLHCHMSTHIH